MRIRLLTFLFIFFATSSVLANGRYPFAQQLVIDPNDAERFWLRTTYGLFTSADAGSTWSWICEDSVGYDPGQDPMLAATEDGTLLVGSQQGLFATHDQGCNYEPVPTVGRVFVNDLDVLRDATRAVLLTTVVEGKDYVLSVFSSDDSGSSFHRVGTTLSRDVDALTIDVAPSDPNRIYVSGFVYGSGILDAGADAWFDASAGRPLPSVLFRSMDGGVTFTRIPIVGVAVEEQVFIAAVHPNNPDVLYVRVAGGPVPSGYITSRLLYSEDAGEHFEEIFRGSADLLGFALSADGSTVFAGLGDSHDLANERPADPSVLGLYRSPAPAFAFTLERAGQVGCLVSAPSGLYVCGDHGPNGFELGVSTDDGKTATSLFDWGAKFGNLLQCPKGSDVATTCTPEWPTECDTYGASCPGQTPPGGGSSASSGCGCGSSPKSSNNDVGTVTLTVPSEPFELAVAFIVIAGAVLRRLRR